MEPPEPLQPDVLRVANANVRFATLHAVNDVTFHLAPGHLLGLIGPNGAGKTTLLRALAGLQPLTSGRIELLGRRIDTGGDELRDVGFTPDTPPVYEELSVVDFLRFVGRGYQLSGPETQERIDFWLDKVWLREKADQKIKQLSRGMRQRLGIARTMLPNPAMVLLDEPAAGLDPAGRVQFRQLLCDLRDQGKMIIVSSHILSDMSEYCTHIAIMSQGRMVRFGTVAEVASHNADRKRYTIGLATALTTLDRKAIDAIEGLAVTSTNTHQLTVEYHADATAAAELIAMLVAKRISVASFVPESAGLEAAYLRAGVAQVD